MTVDRIVRFEHLTAVSTKTAVLLYRTYGPIRCPGTDSNQGLPAHKSETLQLESTFSVWSHIEQDRQCTVM